MQLQKLEKKKIARTNLGYWGRTYYLHDLKICKIFMRKLLQSKGCLCQLVDLFISSGKSWLCIKVLLKSICDRAFCIDTFYCDVVWRKLYEFCIIGRSACCSYLRSDTRVQELLGNSYLKYIFFYSFVLAEIVFEVFCY